MLSFFESLLPNEVCCVQDGKKKDGKRLSSLKQKNQLANRSGRSLVYGAQDDLSDGYEAEILDDDVWQIDSKYLLEQSIRNDESSSGSSSSSSASVNDNSAPPSTMPARILPNPKNRPPHIKLYCGISTGGKPTSIDITELLRRTNNDPTIYDLKDWLCNFVLICKPPKSALVVLKGVESSVDNDNADVFDGISLDGDNETEEIETQDKEVLSYIGTGAVDSAVGSAAGTADDSEDHVENVAPLNIGLYDASVARKKGASTKIVKANEGVVLDLGVATKKIQQLCYYRCILRPSHDLYAPDMFQRLMNRTINNRQFDSNFCKEFIFFEAQRDTVYKSEWWQEIVIVEKYFREKDSNDPVAQDMAFLMYAINKQQWKLAEAMIVVGMNSLNLRIDNPIQRGYFNKSETNSARKIRADLAISSNPQIPALENSLSNNSYNTGKKARKSRRRFHLEVNYAAAKSEDHLTLKTTTPLCRLCHLYARLSGSRSIEQCWKCMQLLLQCDSIDVNKVMDYEVSQSFAIEPPLWSAMRVEWVYTHNPRLHDLVRLLLEKKANTQAQNVTAFETGERTALAYAMGKVHDLANEVAAETSFWSAGERFQGDFRNSVDSHQKIIYALLRLRTDTELDLLCTNCFRATKRRPHGSERTTLQMACRFPVFPEVVKRCLGAVSAAKKAGRDSAARTAKLNSIGGEVDVGEEAPLSTTNNGTEFTDYDHVNALSTNGLTPLHLALMSATYLLEPLYAEFKIENYASARGYYLDPTWKKLLEEVCEVIGLLLAHPEIDVNKKCVGEAMKLDEKKGRFYKAKDVSPLEFVLGWDRFLVKCVGNAQKRDQRSETVKWAVLKEFQKRNLI